MWGLPSRVSKEYSRLHLVEDSEKQDALVATFEQEDKFASLFKRIYLLALHVAFVLALGLLLVQYYDPDTQCLDNGTVLPAELAQSAASVQYEDIIFAPGGFTDHPWLQSEYYGPPSPAKDQIWEDLYSVGVAVISAEEHAQLDGRTTTGLVKSDATTSTSEYVVTLEVFHQLHCLDYLRHASYAVASGHDHHAEETEWSKTTHIAHCVDYLRQVLQCHADMTPIMMEALPGVPALPKLNPPPYRPNFEIRHTCRNWDMVYDFALSRNSTEYKVA